MSDNLHLNQCVKDEIDALLELKCRSSIAIKTCLNETYGWDVPIKRIQDYMNKKKVEDKDGQKIPRRKVLEELSELYR